MAIVQSAVRDDGASVVIKRVRPPLCFDASYLRLFKDEATVHGAVSGGCAHIVRLLDQGEDEQGPFLVFEHIDGTDLGVLLERAMADGNALDVELVLAVAVPLFAALAWVHEAKRDGEALDVVHRDVSPGNVLLGEDGCVKLADFGVAASRLKSEVTVAGELKGKFAYMAPEQTRGEHVTPKADLFAAGVVLWECLQNAKLFDAATDADIVHKVRAVPAPPLDERRVGAALARLVAQLLEKDPDARPASARAVREALDEIALERGLDDGLARLVARAVRQAPRRTVTPIAPDVRRRTQRVIGAVPPAPTPSRRWPLVFVGIAAAAAAALAIGLARADVDNVVVTPLPDEPGPPQPQDVVDDSDNTGVSLAPTTPAPETPPTTTTSAATKPPTKKPATTTTTATTATTTTTTAELGTGKLSINTEPWARVSVDGKVVAAETPLVDFVIAAGRHIVVLENPVVKLKKTIAVDVDKDGHARRFVDLRD